jgi:mannose-6-phosphate isomerase-like protein (cupin superfamily)
MKKTTAHADVRQVDDSLQITDLFDGKEFAFDFVIGILNGAHPPTINRVSDRVYYVMDGEGCATVGDQTHIVGPGDLVVIKAGTPHSISGDLRYVIVTSPPFLPENEKQIAP